MAQNKDKDKDAQKLRRQAEARLKGEALPEESLSPEETARLIHELRVHQIELEMQNDELRQAQHRLEESRLKYSDLYDFAPVGYLTLDRRGHIKEVNLAAARLLGKERDRVVGTGFPLYLAAEDRQNFRRHLASIFQTEVGGRMELRLTTPGSAVIQLESIYIQDARGHGRCRTSLTDVTELKKAQEALKIYQEHLETLVEARTQEVQRTNARLIAEMEERQEAQESAKEFNQQLLGILENLSDGFSTFNDRLEITYFNQAAEQLLGRKREDILGRHLCDAFPETRGTVIEENFFRAVQEKQPRFFETYFDREPYKNWYEIRVYPNPEGISVFFQVTTARKKGEQALRDSEARFKAVFEGAAIGISLKDPEGRYVQVNDAFLKMLGYDREELRRRTCFELTHPEDVPRDHEVYRELVGGHRSHCEWEKRYLRRDGQVLWTHTAVSLIRDDKGEPAFFISMVEDITARREAERALRESREDLNRAQAVAHTGSWRLDVRKNELTWSDENHRIFGIPPGTPMTYETFLSIVHPEDREYVDREWTAALRGEPYDIEHRIVVADTVKWVRERAELEFDPQGRLLGGFGTTQDVSERKQAEEALIRAKEEWERTFDAVTDYIAILDKDHRITRMNRAMTQLLGKPPEQVLGLPCYQAVHGLVEAPDFCPHARVVATGQEQFEEVQEFNRIFAVSVSPLFTPDGQLMGSVHVARDITEQKQAEEALRLERNRLNTLLETMQDGVYIVNQDYEIEYANPALMQEFGQVAGRKCYEYFHDRQEVCPWCKNPEVFAGQTVRWEWYSPMNQKTYDLIDTPIKNADGSFSKLEIFRDITERKRAEEALKKAHDELEQLVEDRTAELQWTLQDLRQEMADRLQAEEEVLRLNKELEQRVRERTAQLEVLNRELESFAYSISHDLRAPLRAIHGFAGILLKEHDAGLDPESQKLMKVMQQSALRMDDLIDALLTFSRMGRTEMRILPLDMGRLADSVFHELQENLPSRNIEFHLQPLTPGEGDPVLIRQVWINLLSNALKFTQTRQTAVIEVGSRRQDHEVIFYVKDNGVGFDMRYVDKLFRVFQRLHGYDEFPGTGVGLALVQRIINRHRGRVWAEGEIDKGATFYFSLPIRKESQDK